MAKALEQTITDQITAKRISAEIMFKINSVDRTDYLINYTVSFDRNFGSASATFVLNNNNGYFGESGESKINVGDIVELSEYFENSAQEWKSFYGRVDQRSISKTSNSRTITLACLDYISILKYWDINLELEGVKTRVENEILKPSYLSAPNDMFAQVFNFANSAIAQLPPPVFSFRDKNSLLEDPNYDGMEIMYDEGQIKLAAPLNVRDNFDFIAKSYYFYVSPLNAEDVLERILSEPDGYGNYLFEETSSAGVIANHLTSDFVSEEGVSTDTLTPNTVALTVTIKHSLVSPTSAGDTAIYLDSVEGLPSSGQATVNGDVITWSGIGSGNTLTGIPSSGGYAVQSHPITSVFSYSKTCSIGQVWYLKYSNVQTALTSSDFSIPSGAIFSYFDARQGRIILEAAIDVASVVTCDTNYSFRTLQATGIELNYIKFAEREVENRFDAINKLRNYLAPNYTIRTQGHDKIWSSYLHQKTVADYTLSLVKSIDYNEDSDLYTRVVLFGKNKNPANLALDGGITFTTTGASYKALATQTELLYDSTTDGWHKFKSSLNDSGKIVTDNFLPILYINGVQVDNRLHEIVFQPVYIEKTTTTETSGGGK